jgi:hypothetical protein
MASDLRLLAVLAALALTTFALLRADASGLKSRKFPSLELNAKHLI